MFELRGLNARLAAKNETIEEEETKKKHERINSNNGKYAAIVYQPFCVRCSVLAVRPNVCVCITAWMNVTECINTKENVKFVLTRLLAYFFYFTLNWSRYGFPRLRSTLSTSSRFRLVRCCLFSILYFFLHFFIFWFAFGLCQSRIGLAIGVATKYVCWRSATMKTPQQSVLWRNGCDAWSKIEVARTSRVSIRYAVLRWNQSELGRWVYRHFWLRFAFLFIFRLGVCVSVRIKQCHHSSVALSSKRSQCVWNSTNSICDSKCRTTSHLESSIRRQANAR